MTALLTCLGVALEVGGSPQAAYHDGAAHLADHFQYAGDAETRRTLIRAGIAIAIPNYRHDWNETAFNTDGLSQLQFAKRLDPFQAAQDLALYVGGLAQREAARSSSVDDRMLAGKHGFDAWSFRRRPESC